MNKTEEKSGYNFKFKKKKEGKEKKERANTSRRTKI